MKLVLALALSASTVAQQTFKDRRRERLASVIVARFDSGSCVVARAASTESGPRHRRRRRDAGDAFDLCQAKADAYAACDPDQEATENFTDDGDDNGVVSGDILTAQFCTAVKSVYPVQPCKGVQLCLDEYIDWMNCVYSDICEEELTCEDEGMADDRCEGMLIWCDSANACTFPTSGAGGCPEFGSQFDNDDSAGGGDDHSGHDHDEGHSSDGATATTPAVLVAALAALAYA